MLLLRTLRPIFLLCMRILFLWEYVWSSTNTCYGRLLLLFVWLLFWSATLIQESQNKKSGAKCSSADNSSLLESCDMLDGLARRPSLATLSPCHTTNCAAPLQCPFFFPCFSCPGWADSRKGLCCTNEHERSSSSASCAHAQAPEARGHENADGQACKWY